MREILNFAYFYHMSIMPTVRWVVGSKVTGKTKTERWRNCEKRSGEIYSEYFFERLPMRLTILPLYF